MPVELLKRYFASDIPNPITANIEVAAKDLQDQINILFLKKP